MKKFADQVFSSTEVTEGQQQATKRMLQGILILVIITSAVISLIDGLVYNRITTLYAMGALCFIAVISLIYLRRDSLWLAKIVIPLGSLIALSYIIWFGNGLHDIGISGFGVIIILSGLTLGGNGAILFGVLSALAVMVVGIAELNGLIAYSFSTPQLPDILIISFVLLSGSFLLRMLLNRFQQTIVLLQQSETVQLQVNAELLQVKNSLEDHVAERTAELSQRGYELETINTQIQQRAFQLEALAQVTQAITAVRDLRELLPRITSVISEKFGFYHVGIFLLDEISQYAVMSAANSEGGKKMLARKHRLKVGEEGIVGYATATGKPRIALDVGKDAVYFNNLELPDTHSEMALPLIIKNIIVGALDVQSTETAAFKDEDIRMLSLLADQVSLAIENARLFDDARKALAESEMVSRNAVREAWARLPEEQKLLGYRYNISGASPLHQLINAGESPAELNNAQGDGSGSAVVPIELRGVVIGKLVVQSASGDKWGQDQFDMIRAVAERVALSAENARLFEETTARAERERLVSEITGRIRSQNDPQAMIKTAIEELRSALGATRVEVIPQVAKNTGKSEA